MRLCTLTVNSCNEIKWFHLKITKQEAADIPPKISHRQATQMIKYFSNLHIH